MSLSELDWSAAAEKRIRHIVYCAEQLMVKRMKLWETRYDRAVEAAENIEELDEAMRRIDRKFPTLGLAKATFEKEES